MKSRLTKLLSAFIAFVSLLSPSPLFAISQGTYDFFAENDILYIDPNAVNGSIGNSCSSTSMSLGDNTNYAGAEVWSEAEMTAIEANRPFYETAVAGTTIPWQILATIHSLEHSLLRSNPSDGNLSGDGSDGAFQIISSSNHANHSDYSFVGPLSDEQFQRQAIDAVGEIMHRNIGDLTDPNNIKKLFFAYNGMAGVYKQQALNLGFSQEEADVGEGSPYVMNRFDAQRDPTVEPTRSNGTWGQIKRDYGPIEYPANNMFGAYVLYTALGGIGGGVGPCHLSSEINALAIQLAWENALPNDEDISYIPKPEYVEAMQLAGTNDTGNGCTHEYQGGSAGDSCDRFVATVYRLTVDPNIPAGAVTNIYDYVVANNNYQQISVSTLDDIQAGDMLIATDLGHIMIMGQLPSGEKSIIDASCGNRTASIRYYTTLEHHVFRWVSV
jgi:hypothetical protein